jgi:hypothetical protein
MNQLSPILTFSECLEIANATRGNKHLMLGNGFSVDLFPNIFNYKVLAERVTSPRIQRLFNELQTKDFEYVMRKLTDALHLVRIYPEGSTVATSIESDLNELRNTLIDVINQSHPANPQAITDDQYEQCRAFLAHFNEGKKYSFNYDLLLYWVYMHFLDDRERTLKFDDGFRHPEDDQSIVTWEIGREHRQSVYYVHGAMHIFSDGGTVEKYTWINSGRTISEQVRESINSQKYPVFISEGTTEHKLSHIQDCSYLGRSFSSLKSIGGNLFIFGHSIRDEDDHVFSYINSQNTLLNNIFISVFGDRQSADNQRIITKVNRWAEENTSKNYHFYDSASAQVWRNQ